MMSEAMFDLMYFIEFLVGITFKIMILILIVKYISKKNVKL